MDKFLIAFGVLCFVTCVYTRLAYRIKEIEPEAEPPSGSLPWISKAAFMPACPSFASAACYPREPRRNSRQRLLRCSTSPGRTRSSRR